MSRRLLDENMITQTESCAETDSPSSLAKEVRWHVGRNCQLYT